MKVFVLKITDDEKNVSVHLFGNWNSVVKRVLENENADGDLAEEIKKSLDDASYWVNEESEYEYEVSVQGCED